MATKQGLSVDDNDNYLNFLVDEVDARGSDRMLDATSLLQHKGLSKDYKENNNTLWSSKMMDIEEVNELSSNEDESLVILEGEKAKQFSYLKHADEEINWLRQRNGELQLRNAELNDQCINYESKLAEKETVINEQNVKLKNNNKEMEHLKDIIEKRIMEENNAKMILDMQSLEYSSKLAERDEYIFARESAIDEMQLYIEQLEYEVSEATEVAEEYRLEISRKEGQLKRALDREEELQRINAQMRGRILSIREKSKVLQKSLVVIENDLRGKENRILSLMDERRECENGRLIDFKLLEDEVRKLSSDIQTQYDQLKSKFNFKQLPHLIGQQQQNSTQSNAGNEENNENCTKRSEQNLFNVSDLPQQDFNVEITKFIEDNIKRNGKLCSLFEDRELNNLNYITDEKGNRHRMESYDNTECNSVVTCNEKDEYNRVNRSVENPEIGAGCDQHVKPCVVCLELLSDCDILTVVGAANTHSNEKVGLSQEIYLRAANDVEVKVDSKEIDMATELSTNIGYSDAERVLRGDRTGSISSNDSSDTDAETSLSYDVNIVEVEDDNMESQTAEISFFGEEKPQQDRIGSKYRGSRHEKNSIDDNPESISGNETYVVSFTTDGGICLAKMASSEDSVPISSPSREGSLKTVRLVSNKLPVEEGDIDEVVQREEESEKDVTHRHNGEEQNKEANDAVEDKQAEFVPNNRILVQHEDDELVEVRLRDPELELNEIENSSSSSDSSSCSDKEIEGDQILVVSSDTKISDELDGVDENEHEIQSPDVHVVDEIIEADSTQCDYAEPEEENRDDNLVYHVYETTYDHDVIDEADGSVKETRRVSVTMLNMECQKPVKAVEPTISISESHTECEVAEHADVISRLEKEVASLKTENQVLIKRNSQILDEVDAHKTAIADKDDVIQAAKNREEYLVDMHHEGQDRVAELEKVIVVERAMSVSKANARECEGCNNLKRTTSEQEMRIKDMSEALANTKTELEKMKAEMDELKRSNNNAPAEVIIAQGEVHSKKRKKRKLFCA
eukprot:gene14275-15762_t